MVLVYDDETDIGPSWDFSYSNAIVDNTTHTTSSTEHGDHCERVTGGAIV